EGALAGRGPGRVLDGGGHCGDVAPAGRRNELCAKLVGGDRRDARRPEQRGRLADAVALFDPGLQPLDARDVLLAVATLAAGRPVRAQDAVALLPLPDRVRRDAGTAVERRDIERWRHRNLLEVCPKQLAWTACRRATRSTGPRAACRCWWASGSRPRRPIRGRRPSASRRPSTVASSTRSRRSARTCCCASKAASGWALPCG